MLKISIGIPAYNEEINIKRLLEALLRQEQGIFELLEIIVSSDASTDSTVELANSIGDSRIKVIDNKDRRGQAERQNQIAETFMGDVLVLLNADILPADENFLQRLVVPFYRNNTVGLISCKGQPAQAETYVEKVINLSVEIRDDMVESLGNTNNVYLCHGFARAFSRAFAQKLRWPGSVGEDAYSYFMAKNLGYGFYYEPQAIIQYRSPQTLKDHLKQSIRFKHSKEILKNSFPELHVDTEYGIPRQLIAKTLGKYLFTHPILTFSYLAFQVFGLFNPYQVKHSETWEPAQSSKRI